MIVASQTCLSEADTTELASTLEALVQGHQSLLSILQEEKRLIIEGKVDQLVHCVSQKEGVLSQIAQLEKERITVTQRLTLSQKPTTLKKLIPLTSPSSQKKLEMLRSRLEALTTSIDEINQMNGILIDRVLGQISNLFAMLRHLTAGEETYQQSGEMSAAASGRTISRG